MKISREKNIAGTLEDFIHHYGARNALSQIGYLNKEIIRMYAITAFQCEPHHEHQNFAKRRIRKVKKLSSTLLDRSGSPPSFWLLCVQHIVYIQSRLSTENLQGKTPLKSATGQQPDVFAILAFHWYEAAYFRHYKSISDKVFILLIL